MGDLDALLAVHEVERRAHLEGDADLFATVFGEEIVEASGGEVRTLTREQLRERFAGAFSRVRYLEWSDTVAPIGAVLGDTGWLMVRVHARRETIDGEPLPDFDAAWIAIYERREGSWGLRAISSSVVEAS